jgi:hypothetical protein
VYSAVALDPAEAGSIPHVRLGRAVRFIPADVLVWLRQGCPPAEDFEAQREEEARRRRK